MGILIADHYLHKNISGICYSMCMWRYLLLDIKSTIHKGQLKMYMFVLPLCASPSGGEEAGFSDCSFGLVLSSSESYSVIRKNCNMSILAKYKDTNIYASMC